MIQASFEMTGANVADAFKRAKPQVLAGMERETRKQAIRATRIWQQRYRSASATSATATRVGTGQLRASIAQQVRRSGDAIEGVVGLYRFGAKGNVLAYGAVHEEGGVIRSSKGGYLAIPLGAIRSPSGVAPPPSSFSRDETFVLNKGPFGSGGIICRKVGQQIVPLYLLRREVRVPARPQGGAINAAVREVEPDLLAALERIPAEALGAPQ
jgi:hypothetical protein